MDLVIIAAWILLIVIKALISAGISEDIEIVGVRAEGEELLAIV